MTIAACGRVGFEPRTDGAIDPTAVRSQLALPHDPGELLADFPLMVRLDDAHLARDLMQPDASDLRFFDAAGNVLASEVEELGGGGAPLVAWVRVPSISGTSTKIFVDYGHGPPVAPSSQSVWGPSYAAVYHCGDLTDATTHHNDGTTVAVSGSLQVVDGVVGNAHGFTGTSHQAISIADAASLSPTTGLTVSGWIFATTLAATSGYTAIISREHGSSVDDDFWLGIDQSGPIAYSTVTTPAGTFGGQNGAVSIGAWTHLAMTYDGTAERLYIGATEVLSTAVTGIVQHDPHPLILGADRNSGGATPPDVDFVDGDLDEIRLETVARSAVWIAYDLASMTDALITYGTVQR